MFASHAEHRARNFCGYSCYWRSAAVYPGGRKTPRQTAGASSVHCERRESDQMHPLSPAVHRTILAVDVEGFCDRSRTNPDQLAVREGLYRALRAAFAASGMCWEDCYREDRGDGAFVLISPDVPKDLVAARFPEQLSAALRRHNQQCAEAVRIRLRVAVHAGEVHHDEHGVAGAAINMTFRLLEAAPVKSALAASPGVAAMIVSEWFFEEVVRHDPASKPAAYRRVPVAVKETHTTAWVRLSDHPSPPSVEADGA